MENKMTDIVDRLRNNLIDATHLMGYDKTAITEAADEIERLRIKNELLEEEIVYWKHKSYD
jgi:hypothetical protein